MAHGHEQGHSREGHTHNHHDHTAGMLSGSNIGRAFVLGITLNLIYVAVELGAGIGLDSLALVSDAGHNLSDVVSLVLALLAFRLARLKPTARYTYGYRKSTVLVSLLNACILLVAVGIIIWESVQKLRFPQPVAGDAIAWVAGVGIVVNAFTAWLFMKDRKRDLNIRGAYLHMAADTLVSVGVVISGIIIGFTGWYIIDPIIGLVVAAVILVSTAELLLGSLRLSLDGVPAGIDPEKVRHAIQEAAPEVQSVHHLHIWALSTTENALTAHIVAAPGTDGEKLKHSVKHSLEDLGITHSTLELECPGETCDPCGCGAG